MSKLSPLHLKHCAIALALLAPATAHAHYGGLGELVLGALFITGFLCSLIVVSLAPKGQKLQWLFFILFCYPLSFHLFLILFQKQYNGANSGEGFVAGMVALAITWLTVIIFRIWKIYRPAREVPGEPAGLGNLRHAAVILLLLSALQMLFPPAFRLLQPGGEGALFATMLLAASVVAAFGLTGGKPWAWWLASLAGATIFCVSIVMAFKHNVIHLLYGLPLPEYLFLSLSLLVLLWHPSTRMLFGARP